MWKGRKERNLAITADLDGHVDLKKIRLPQEDLLGHGAELPDLGFLQMRLLPGLTLLHLQQPPYDIIQQNTIHPARSFAEKLQREKKDREETELKERVITMTARAPRTGAREKMAILFLLFTENHLKARSLRSFLSITPSIAKRRSSPPPFEATERKRRLQY